MKFLGAIVNKRTAPYLFLTPFLIFFFIFRMWPIVWSVFISFNDLSGLTNLKFIGFQNYLWILKDARFWTATYNTLYFVVIYNLIMVFFSIVLAVLLDSSFIKGRKVYRSIYFAPIAMSLPVVAMVFDLVLARGSGLLSIILGYLGITLNTRWVTDPGLAMWAVILMRVWRGTGYYCAYFLAGLTSISPEIYESAKVDGASPVKTFFKITIPMLRPMILFVVIMSTILSFQLFDEPWILTQGGPADATLTLQIYLYQASFLEGHLGRGSAVSYLMTILMMGASVFYMKRLGEKE